MERRFDEDLQRLKDRLLSMAGITQDMIELALTSLRDRREDLARQALDQEPAVNRLEVEVEDAILSLLATQQPAARDLRFLAAALKINSDLERVADQACNISETTLFHIKERPPVLPPPVDLSVMGMRAQTMIRESIFAFIHHDPALAKKVCSDDDEVDRAKEGFFKQLLNYMRENPNGISGAMELVLISRNIEKIADHATNISEEVIFIEEGRNFKHHFWKEP